jgi:hypothetical protein
VAVTSIWSTSLQSALSTTPETVKSSDGYVGGWYVFNPNAAAAYIQFFDESGTITLGSTTPKMSIGIPAGAGANVEFRRGIPFTNSIKVAATTTATGSSANASALVCNFLYG